MTATTLEDMVRAALRSVTLGQDGPDIVSSGLVYDVVATGPAVRVLLDPDKIPDNDADSLADFLAPMIQSLRGVERVVIKPRPKSVADSSRPRVARYVLGVHSGKGGVGKSTLAANLAVALGLQGLKVGVLDADVYGPSMPTLFGLSGRAEEVNGKIEPKEAHGVKVMSLGFLLPPEKALAWRGSLVDEGLPALLSEVAWGDLDVLVIDLPPGTSDVHLSLARHAHLSAVLTVTTPGAIALIDVRRGMEMFADMAVPCLGIVENMAGVACTSCGHVTQLFGDGGAAALSQETGLTHLASIPFVADLSLTGDAGVPYVIAAPEAPPSRAITALAVQISKRIPMEAFA
ncbi:MAG: Mrp/NBP35 family ATP-binding protein [Alphaproteobacteria bacterium]|nr:Mrp/NBP35 family ATP-binding protein [Alphaproteobacteria bacterium]